MIAGLPGCGLSALYYVVLASWMGLVRLGQWIGRGRWAAPAVSALPAPARRDR